MLKLFALQFIFSIFLLTLFIPISLFIFGQCIWFSSIYVIYIYRNKKYTIWLLVSCFAVTMAFLSTYRFYFTNSLLYSNSNNWSISWIVVWGRKDNVYILETNYWEIFLRNVGWKLNYWQKISVKGKISLTDISMIWKMFPLSSTQTYWEFNYDTWRWVNWILWDMYSPSFAYLETRESNLISFKWSLVQYIDNIYWSRNGSLFSWLLIWDIFHMSKEEYQIYINSSLVHLVAVSWWNLLMIAAGLWIILFIFPYYIRLILIWIWVCVYGWAVWLDSSIQRALLMFICLYLSYFFWRRWSLIRNLGIAWLTLLIYNPYILSYDLGFSLSFWAVYGIIFLSSYIKSIEESFNVSINVLLKNYVFPTFWASLWTYPILLFFIWPINIVGIIGNLLIVPMLPFIYLCWILSLIFTEWSHWFILYSITKFFLEAIYYIAFMVSKYWIYLWQEESNNLVYITSILFLYFLFYYIKRNKFFLKQGSLDLNQNF